ncbi:MAG TPA: DegT/DnrJ/EryC1/StrS family aminotransferase, partial [Gaiellaceae bacterium]|nr:DegT/DnrJ/EryC1/StrS family aminotransferase [Gaiellaceae bacterium]
IRVLFRPAAVGVERLPAAGFVLCSNQLSNLDGFALANPMYPRQVQWMGKSELFKPVLGGVLRRLGIFPVRRGRGDVEAIQRAVELARAGHAVGIFPEGTRRSKGFRKTHRARPHSGAARVALAAGVPLVPAAIAGTDRLTALRRWRVAFGSPVPVDDLEPDAPGAAREATRRLMDAIERLEAELASAPPASRRLHPRHRLDISFADLAFAAAACVAARRRGRESRVLQAWGDPQALVCLSVRSAWELLLDALQLREGDEIAFSAITHPDMVRIAAARGLRALPVDVDPESLSPGVEALGRALGPRTRVLVVAHLFGGSVDLRPAAELARRRGVLVVEDCAQSLRGPNEWVDPNADVSLFSFGSIKTATALGGAIVHVADAGLAERMRSFQAAWPVQKRREYGARVAKLAVLRALGRPYVYRLFASSLAVLGRELDTVVNGSVKGFPGPDLLRRIRRRPAAPLLALLERRLRRFDHARLGARARTGERVASSLPGHLRRPGRSAVGSTHWVFPVLAADRVGLVSSLRLAGFDAATATSGIAAVAGPPDRPDLEPTQARRTLEQIVFLPVYPELGAGELDRLAETVAVALADER